jgi:tetratricopeptide (TPR) repeat protein
LWKEENVLRKAGRFDAAISDFDRALELNPNFTGANRKRGMTHKLIGDQEKARAHLSIALRAQPNDIQITDALRDLQRVPITPSITVPPKPPPVETPTLAEAREFLDDTQTHIRPLATRSAATSNPVGNRVSIASGCVIAVSR